MKKLLLLLFALTLFSANPTIYAQANGETSGQKPKDAAGGDSDLQKPKDAEKMENTNAVAGGEAGVADDAASASGGGLNYTYIGLGILLGLAAYYFMRRGNSNGDNSGGSSQA